MSFVKTQITQNEILQIMISKKSNHAVRQIIFNTSIKLIHKIKMVAPRKAFVF